jgi:hypothetical protein
MSEQITVYVGSVVVANNGHRQDDRVPVVFEGEELGSYTRYGAGRNGGLSDTRGVTETLYRTADGRLVAHVYNWSRWQGEPDTKQLCEVSEADLSPTGRFAELGHEAGFWNAMTLDQALQTQGDQRGEGV